MQMQRCSVCREGAQLCIKYEHAGGFVLEHAALHLAQKIMREDSNIGAQHRQHNCMVW